MTDYLTFMKLYFPLFLLRPGDPSLPFGFAQGTSFGMTGHYGVKEGKEVAIRTAKVAHDEFLTNRHFFPLHIP